MESAKKTSRNWERAGRPEWTIELGELQCRVREEGAGRVAKRLAMSRDELQSALRGKGRLSPERVVALRSGAVLGAAVLRWRREERRAA
jgi:hypothetical protein